MSEICMSKREEHRYINQDEEAWFELQHDLECVDRNPEDFIEPYQDGREEKYEESKKFLERELGPLWYQELSVEQIEAVDQILPSLQDCDCRKFLGQPKNYIENYIATHARNRIKMLRQLLWKVGIKPLPNRSQMKYAVKFSRGNDLAFLWFLFEMVYCEEDDFEKIRDYSVNERLLLSCISHLDMMSTLRELDKLLPRKGEIPKDPRCPKELKKVTSTDNFPKVKLVPFKLMNRSTPLYPKPKYWIYSAYKDPSFVIPNETNRWFTEGKLKKTEEEKMAQQIIKEALRDGLEDSEEIAESQALCLKHKQKKNEVLPRIMKFDKYQEGNFDRANPAELHREGVVYRLDLDINKNVGKFKESDKKFEARVVIRMLLKQMLEGSMDRNYFTNCLDCLEATRKKETPESKAGITDCKVDAQKESSEEKPCYLDPPVEQRNVDGEFFVSSPEKCEFTFRYDKIFHDYCKSSDPVKKCIDRALNIDKHYSEDAAISACLEAMWKSELGAWEQKEKLNTYLNENYVMIKGKEDYDSPEKCFDLLKRGLTVIRKNPKLVLASFPDVDTIPVLREWVLNRYGFRHSLNDVRRKELMQKIHMNEVIYNGAAPLKTTLKVFPHAKSFGVKKSQKTVDKFLKMITRTSEQFAAAAMYPQLERGFRISDKNSRFISPKLYMYKPYASD